MWLQRSVFQAFYLQVVVLIWHMAAGISHYHELAIHRALWNEVMSQLICSLTGVAITKISIPSRPSHGSDIGTNAGELFERRFVGLELRNIVESNTQSWRCTRDTWHFILWGFLFLKTSASGALNLLKKWNGRKSEILFEVSDNFIK